MNSSVLVTGADGLVGRAVCRRLLHERIPFIALTRRPSVFVQNSMIHDLTVDRSLVDVIRGHVSVVVHLAAAVPMSAAYPDTEEMADLTRRMDAGILRAAKIWGCPVLYASTCGLYDRKIDRLKSEDDTSLINVCSPYLAAKREGEEKFLAQGDSTVMRLSAMLGPGQRRNSIVSRFIESARTDGTITLWGSGRRQQNFVDVLDVAEFVKMALGSPVPGTFNVATSTPTTMLELARLIMEIVGRGRVVLAGRDDPNELDTADYDVRRAQFTYGWSAKTSLAQSLQNLCSETFRE